MRSLPSALLLSLLAASAASVGCEDEKVAPVDPHLVAQPESIDLGDVVAVSYTHLTLPTGDLV